MSATGYTLDAVDTRLQTLQLSTSLRFERFWDLEWSVVALEAGIASLALRQHAEGGRTLWSLSPGIVAAGIAEKPLVGSAYILLEAGIELWLLELQHARELSARPYAVAGIFYRFQSSLSDETAVLSDSDREVNYSNQVSFASLGSMTNAFVEKMLKSEFGKEIRKALQVKSGLPSGVGPDAGGVDSGNELPRSNLPTQLDDEAIVRRFGRPSLLVQNGTFEPPASGVWSTALNASRSRLERAIAAVGRVELIDGPMEWVGTAWMIGKNIAVTNRHVALEFGAKAGGGFEFRRNVFGGGKIQARLNFKSENQSLVTYRVAVKRIIFISDTDDSAPDLAFLELATDKPLPAPIPLQDGKLSQGDKVVAIGFPAFDDRNNAGDQARIFGDVYGVKRVAPGEIMVGLQHGSVVHDCSTLGGSSGSALIDVKTGAAVGLHFSGKYTQANFAVPAGVLKKFLEDHSSAKSVAPAHDDLKAMNDESEKKQPKAGQLTGRKGYDPGFLGGGFEVPLPHLSAAQKAAAAPVQHQNGDERFVLKYTHHSVVMNKERRMAFFTATNIDGARLQRLKRGKDVWFFDPRIEKSAQVGNELYQNNDLDRGHLTRRLDPAWGESAKQGEEDTFFFTNCTPQHSAFNQHIWSGLEDYLLDNAETSGFRACIFTGPVLDDENDPPYRDVQLPRAYWKVAVMIAEDGGGLSATAYMISQADLISDIEFVYGQYKTYQVTVAKIESLTGLSFGSLADSDPLGGEEGLEQRELLDHEEIILHRPKTP